MSDEPNRESRGPPPPSHPDAPPQRPAPPPPPPPPPGSAAPPPPGWTRPGAPAGWSSQLVASAPGSPSEPDFTQQPWAVQAPPPSQQGSGQASTPTRLRPIGGLATATKVALGTMTMLSAVSVALEVNYASKIDRLFDGDGSFSQALDAEDIRSGFSAVFAIGTLVTAVLWVLWIQRAIMIVSQVTALQRERVAVFGIMAA